MTDTRDVLASAWSDADVLVFPERPEQSGQRWFLRTPENLEWICRMESAWRGRTSTMRTLPPSPPKKRWLLIQSPGSFPISDCALKGMLLFCGTSSHMTINCGIVSL